MKKSNIVGNISSIETMGMHDGPGVRMVIFMQGCALRCLYCHNPETWNVAEKKQTFTPEQLVEKILRYKPYFQNNGGVTFSGGEPLLQAEFVYACVKLLKKHNIHVALDTAGVGPLHVPLLKLCDLLIVDVKAVNSALYTHITKQPIHSFQTFMQTVQTLHKPLWLRQVLVPGINNTKQQVDEFIAFANSLHHVEKVEVLAYHTLGVDKYTQQNIPYALQGVKAMEEKEKETWQAYVNAHWRKPT